MLWLLQSIVSQAQPAAETVGQQVAQYTGPGGLLIGAVALAKSLGLFDRLKGKNGNGGGSAAVLAEIREIRDGVQAGLEAHAEQATVLKPMAQTISELRHEMTELRVAVAKLEGKQ